MNTINWFYRNMKHIHTKQVKDLISKKEDIKCNNIINITNMVNFAYIAKKIYALSIKRWYAYQLKT